MSKKLKAKIPTKPVDGYLTPTAHKMIYKETEQHDPITKLPNGIYSSLKLLVVQDWDDVIFISIEVDGKQHNLSHELVELLQTLKDLSQEEPA